MSKALALKWELATLGRMVVISTWCNCQAELKSLDFNQVINHYGGAEPAADLGSFRESI